MAPRGRPTRPTRLNPGTTPPPVADPTTTTSVTGAQLQAMIDEGVTAVLAARATTRNGDDSHTSGTGTEGVVDLTQWFERMETVFRIMTNDVAYAMTWSDLKKKMTTKYCPRNEIKKIEAEMWNLKTDKIEKYVSGMPDLIYSSVVASKPKTMQEAIEMATELMDRRINTLAERQTENKRKFEDAPRNNQNQQPNKRQNTGRAYAAGNGDKKSYEGTKPLCPKCNFNHYGPCIPTCTNCKKLGHLVKSLSLLGSWAVLVVRVESNPSNPSPPLAFHHSQPWMGGLSVLQVGRGYRCTIRWKWVRGELERIGPSKSSQSLSIAHKWAVVID
ncbi:hypothetical protein Tco_0633596 [Tanacetum coccineum]